MARVFVHREMELRETKGKSLDCKIYPNRLRNVNEIAKKTSFTVIASNQWHHRNETPVDADFVYGASRSSKAQEGSALPTFNFHNSANYGIK